MKKDYHQLVAFSQANSVAPALVHASYAISTHSSFVAHSSVLSSSSADGDNERYKLENMS